MTVFEGDDTAPRDDEAYGIWKKIFEENHVTGERIYFLGAKSNWWSAGDSGPCGPDTEMFYDMTGTLAQGMTKEEYLAADDRQDIVEIWNDVFMEYEKKDGVVIGKLANKNVDTGSGLERVVMAVQGKNNIFDTDLFDGTFAQMNAHGYVAEYTDTPELLRATRIIADHIRTSVFMIADGVRPSNKDQGYALRRLIRRGIRYAEKYIRVKGTFASLSLPVIEKYGSVYINLKEQAVLIEQVIAEESQKFLRTLEKGNKEFEKRIASGTLTGKDAFDLFATYGFPFEMTCELAQEQGIELDMAEFASEFKNHQDLSRAGSVGKFKGGMADHGEMSVKYHTATHLLQQALRTVLGDHVMQKGSNITAERLRFDFSHPSKMTEEEIRRAESIVNEKIHEALPVSYQDLPLAEAKKLGAIGLFGEKYGETVRVYKVGDFSLEFCGGPHVTNTSELGTFKITKEEASSAGVRRIKAVLV